MNMRENDFDQMRHRMVIGQLLSRDVKDPKVLNVFEKVPRHKFISSKLHKDAYSDFPLPIENGQAISQPYIVALMVQLLDIMKTDNVLEIGTGSGYETAILAELAGWVFSIERLKDLTEKSGKVLRKMGYKNITLKTGDGTIGWKEFAPFDKIVVTAGSEKIQRPLIEQLKSPGKLALPVGSRTRQKILLVEKTDKGGILEKEICDCAFVPLIGRYGWGDDNARKDI